MLTLCLPKRRVANCSTVSWPTRRLLPATTSRSPLSARSWSTAQVTRSCLLRNGRRIRKRPSPPRSMAVFDARPKLSGSRNHAFCQRPLCARSCHSRRLVSRCIKKGTDLITIYPVSGRQRELKQSTMWLVFARPQPPAVFFDDGATDRKSHAHAAGLCREEWLEQLLEVVRAQAGTRVPHRDAHLFLSALGADS